MHALVSDPGEPPRVGPLARAWCVRDGVAFRCTQSVGLCDYCYFEAQSHGLHTRCLRFVVTVARVLIYDQAKLAPGWWHSFAGRVFHPLGSFVKFQLRCLSVASSSPRLGLAHERRTD